MRWIFICLLVVLIVLLSFYSVNHRPWIHLKDCLENPEKCDGKLVTDYNEPRIQEIYSDGFLLEQRLIPSIRVYSDTTNLITGEYIGLQAIFHKEGYLEATIVRIAKNREEKIWVSVLPVLFVGFLFFRYYRFNIKKCQFELRKHA